MFKSRDKKARDKYDTEHARILQEKLSDNKEIELDVEGD